MSTLFTVTIIQGANKRKIFFISVYIAVQKGSNIGIESVYAQQTPLHERICMKKGTPPKPSFCPRSDMIQHHHYSKKSIPSFSWWMQIKPTMNALTKQLSNPTPLNGCNCNVAWRIHSSRSWGTDPIQWCKHLIGTLIMSLNSAFMWWIYLH
jgi:hypothetical protein